jgi:hypothetical protein
VGWQGGCKCIELIINDHLNIMHTEISRVCISSESIKHVWSDKIIVTIFWTNYGQMTIYESKRKRLVLWGKTQINISIDL